MCFFPGFLEFLHFLSISFISEKCLVVLFEFGNALVLDDHLLVVTPALCGCPLSEIVGKGAKYFANSK